MWGWTLAVIFACGIFQSIDSIFESSPGNQDIWFGVAPKIMDHLGLAAKASDPPFYH